MYAFVTFFLKKNSPTSNLAEVVDFIVLFGGGGSFSLWSSKLYSENLFWPEIPFLFRTYGREPGVL